MNDKIITTQQSISISENLRRKGKKIVVAGGCFDIIHIGHIAFLKKAKQQADILFLLLENDKTVKQRKGPNRPFNTQKDRAEILAHLTLVDYVILLPVMTTNAMYDELVIHIKPAIIATTAGDANRSHKERQAHAIGAKVVDVMTQISNQSTTKIIHLLNEL
ncbi:MAG TPA: adenylyltransferase/cytidyltransferase family protein [Methylomirabilota bacterium]|nr:adenylyltransferase/cytidyltransferase family protein [Methylomirabilota bacterium]